MVEEARDARSAREWEDREEELFGPAETLHSTYRLLRDELLEGTMRAGGRLGELRFDTDLDVSHAVVRYLELLKLAALIERPDGQSRGRGAARRQRADPRRRSRPSSARSSRPRRSTTTCSTPSATRAGEPRRSPRATSRRSSRSCRRAATGVVLSASDIDTYRDVPAEVQVRARVPDPAGADDPPALRDRRAPGARALPRAPATGASASLAELLGLLDAGWRRGGFGDSEEERQLRGKAAAALTRYHERFQSRSREPLWFERSFTFKLGRICSAGASTASTGCPAATTS